MQPAPSLEFLQRELRSQICRRCYIRPVRSGSRGPDVPRACEAKCAIFTTLLSVRRIGECLDPMVEPYEQALQSFYRDFCENRVSAASSCPSKCDPRALRRYRHQVIEILAGIFNRRA
jgi:hypothetical protein